MKLVNGKLAGVKVAASITLRMTGAARLNAGQLEAEDHSAFMRTVDDRSRAEKNQAALLQYLAAKYGLGERDQITPDGGLIRHSRVEGGTS